MNYVGPTGKASGLSGTGYKQVTQQAYTPEQYQLFQRLFGQVAPEGFLSKLAGGDEAAFQQAEAPAWRNYEEGLGRIGERFSGMGGTGARRSSAFQNTMGSYAQDFAQQLASQRMGLQRQALSDMMNISNQLMGYKPYETAFVAKQQKPMSFWQQMLLGGVENAQEAAKTAGKLIPMFL